MILSHMSLAHFINYTNSPRVVTLETCRDNVKRKEFVFEAGEGGLKLCNNYCNGYTSLTARRNPASFTGIGIYDTCSRRVALDGPSPLRSGYNDECVATINVSCLI